MFAKTPFLRERDYPGAARQSRACYRRRREASDHRCRVRGQSRLLRNFYVSEALLAERGLRFSKHSGVHSAFGSEFAKSGVLDPKYHRWLITAFNKRIAADYGVEVEITADDACALVEQAKEFASAARTFLASP